MMDVLNVNQMRSKFQAVLGPYCYKILVEAFEIKHFCLFYISVGYAINQAENKNLPCLKIPLFF